MTNPLSRRNILQNTFLVGAAGLAGVAQARALCTTTRKTPAQPEGPFYPVVPQNDVDSDLTLIEGETERARGEIVELTVLVQDQNCRPVANTLIDLWQACATGKYNHPLDPNTADIDPYFQGWAKVLTDASGVAHIRTIKPGAYPASDTWIRPPHIHFKISAQGFAPLTTQMYFAGEALNAQDEYLKVMTAANRSRLIVNFTRSSSLAIPAGEFTVTLLDLSPQ